MQKITNFTMIGLICLIMGVFSCKETTVAVDKNSALQNDNETIISAAESRIGKLVKIDKEFIDNETGSLFTLTLAAKEESQINDFLQSNSIVFKGIDKNMKKELLKPKSQNFQSLPQSTQAALSQNDNFDSEDVFYDLKSKKLKGNAVGFSFSIIPQIEKQQQKTGIKAIGISWCQQTSLAFCETASVHMKVESYPSAYQIYRQTRGIFWSGSGLPDGNVVTNGSVYWTNVDGPKFTRIGGYDPITSKIDHITWYDLQTNSQVSAN